MEAGRVSKTDAEYQNIFPLSSRYSNILNIMEYQERAGQKTFIVIAIAIAIAIVIEGSFIGRNTHTKYSF